MLRIWTPYRVGYLHTLAVDGQFWTAIDNGLFEEQGLNVEPIQFNSGIPLPKLSRAEASTWPSWAP
ncbi:MAG: hypothetical protein U5K81_13325 [Trueperaceae bacterium]|nr:hypothetical protein [Trueperaceae bacterium]